MCLFIMNWNDIMTDIYNTIGTPLILGLIGFVAYIGTKIFKQVKILLSAKIELMSITSENRIREQVYSILNSLVEAAVASNMPIAETLKKRNNGKLEATDIKELQNSCKQLVEHSLPSSLLQEDSSTLNIIGGKDKLESMVSTLIEKHVYEYHNKCNKCNNCA